MSQTGRWIAAGETEGSSALAIADQNLGDGLWRMQNFSGGYSHYFDPLLPQPGIALRIALRPITHVVNDAIDFNRDLGLGAVEVENVGSDRMLAAKVNAVGRALEQAPQQDLGKREVLA